MHTIKLDAEGWRRDFLEQVGTAAFEVDVSPGAAPDSGTVLPVAVSRTGDGARVLVVGGTHGDEFEGQVAVASLVRRLPSLQLSGTIIAVARHNVSACAAGTRRSPVDGADLNRAYPGRGGEGPSAAIAAFVTEHLLPNIDWLIDLHSGGAAHEFVLSSNLQARAGSEDDQILRPALAAFGAPYAILFDDLGSDVMPHRGTLEGAARELGVRCISSELGGGARLTRASAECAQTGLIDLLVHIGALDARHRSQRRASPTYLRLDRPENYLAAATGGIFVPTVELGGGVASGEVVGYLHNPDPYVGEPAAIVSELDGIVVALTARALLQAGEVAVMVAEPA